ncbi:uncharacterized protein LOC131643950 [Vicia villosa]|uniref:uncharacterized protein LOC131643950 n=1 Tax=Vicia villosa TaxID=3911 RepID=UPI00273AD5CD|nr:uncharacterized protein LOC131643950 [Vicia villosa]
MNLPVWNKVTLLKCLWNICKKSDNLWIQWVHKVYLKGRDVMSVDIGSNWTWIIKKIVKCRMLVDAIRQLWNHMSTAGKFSMRKVYNCLMEDISVPWYSLLMHNLARPRACITVWMLCHNHLPTKDRLYRFGIIGNTVCSLCGMEEDSANHLFFSCPKTAEIWHEILNWLGVCHIPQDWNHELQWILASTKGKGWRARILKLAVIETIHETWLFRNSIVFNNDMYRNNTKERIIDSIVYRGWRNRKIRLHIANLMV